MATKYALHVSTRQTSQQDAIPGKAMVPNSAGGQAFAIDNWSRLDRFLILGCEGGTYYATEQKLTQENSKCVLDCFTEDPKRTIKTIVDVSTNGRAPKNAPAVFALAMLSKSPDALEAMPKVCRTSTYFFSFIDQAQHFRGRGRAFKRALQSWYLDKSPRDVAYQLTKYQQRDGWSHRDVLRLCKPRPPYDQPTSRDRMFAWAVGKHEPSEVWSNTDEMVVENLVPIIAFEEAKLATSAKEVAKIIGKYRLVRECVPSEFLNDPDVWEALLTDMPMTAMIRNLGKMSSIGLIKPLSHASQLVADRLTKIERLKKARIHPLGLLIALSIYQRGRGLRGSLDWNVDSRIVEALNEAFYLAFESVEPTGKRWLLGLDVSGSMDSQIMNTCLSCRDASAALAMVAVRIEPLTHCVTFTSNHGYSRHNASVKEFPLSKSQRLDDVVKNMDSLPFGGTDCSLPMLYALENGIDVDVFCVLTDNETWAGSIHPCQALQKYRDKTGILAKLIVCGMTSTGFSIADTNDAGMMDVVGFDTSAPSVMADFARD